MDDNGKKNIFIGIIMIVIFIFIIKGISSNSINNSSSSLPKDPSQMTNKQLEQYLEWNEKQNQREHDNAPAFK